MFPIAKEFQLSAVVALDVLARPSLLIRINYQIPSLYSLSFSQSARVEFREVSCHSANTSGGGGTAKHQQRKDGKKKIVKAGG